MHSAADVLHSFSYKRGCATDDKVSTLCPAEHDILCPRSTACMACAAAGESYVTLCDNVKEGMHVAGP